MISIEDYLQGKTTLDKLSDEIVGNINTLIPKVNDLLEKFGEHRDVNSGLRTLEYHLKIYESINKSRKAKKLPELKVPMASNHLKGAAVDLEDADGRLYLFCTKNIPLLERLCLYCEVRQGGWLHIQIFAPRSGNRFFNP